MEILLTPQQTTKHALSIQIESLWCSKCLYKISSSTMIDIIKKEKEKKKKQENNYMKTIPMMDKTIPWKLKCYIDREHCKILQLYVTIATISPWSNPLGWCADMIMIIALPMPSTPTLTRDCI